MWAFNQRMLGCHYVKWWATKKGLKKPDNNYMRPSSTKVDTVYEFSFLHNGNGFTVTDLNHITLANRCCYYAILQLKKNTRHNVIIKTSELLFPQGLTQLIVCCVVHTDTFLTNYIIPQYNHIRACMHLPCLVVDRLVRLWVVAVWGELVYIGLGQTAWLGLSQSLGKVQQRLQNTNHKNTV